MTKKITYNDKYYYENFIDEETRELLLKLIDEDSQIFVKKNGTKRAGKINQNNHELYQIIQNLKNKLIELERLENFTENHLQPDFLAYYGKDSECIIHRDDISNMDDWNHIRYNVLLSKADEGGETIIDKIEYDFPEKSLWRCFSSGEYHGSKKILSEKPRIVLSLGFLIKKSS